jgi:hypothetical protein
MFDTLGGLLLGVLLGMRHAIEPDHLAAVATLVTDGRTRFRGALVGAFWGVGHTFALLVVGVALVALRTTLSASLADAFELAVAVMLVLLGVRAIRRAAAADEAHAHGGPGVRPFFVGLVHGLAGSGALTALVFAGLPTTASRFAYITLFGLGSVAGMAILSGLAGWPLALLGQRPRARRALAIVTGAVSVLVGVAWGWQVLR